MKLGLEHNQVEVVPYDRNWQSEFAKTKDAILKTTQLPSRQVEHIGSTAIEGIKAKPIIDMLLGVDQLSTLDEQFFTALKKIGFYRLKVQKETEIVCAKFTDETFTVKTHIMHLVEFEKTTWQELIFFRDFLNENHEAKKAYEGFKTSFLRQIKGASKFILTIKPPLSKRF